MISTLMHFTIQYFQITTFNFTYNNYTSYFSLRLLIIVLKIFSIESTKLDKISQNKIRKFSKVFKTI